MSSPKYIPTREPDLQARWRAWKVVPSEADGPHGGLSTWLLHCPGAHAVWSYWVMSLVHLRPDPDLPVPSLQYPAAQFEIVVFALHQDSRPDPDDVSTLQLRLDPIDHAIQFDGISEELAIEMVERLTRYIVGGLSPDSGFRDMWRSLINNSVHYLKNRGTP